MILIDLQKAFGTLNHDKLLDKMKYLGFTSKAIDWFGSYLKRRNIVVNLEKTFRNSNFELRCPSKISLHILEKIELKESISFKRRNKSNLSLNIT